MVASRPPLLAELATPERITYARDRASAFESRSPMVALIYRVVADVLEQEQDNNTPTEEENAA
jgi:hypothetical protein